MNSDPRDTSITILAWFIAVAVASVIGIGSVVAFIHVTRLFLAGSLV